MIAANDGNECLVAMEQMEFAAILLDLMMHGMNGFDVLDELRKERPALLQKIIIVTAFSRPRNTPLEVDGVFAVIRKPFDIDELLATIEGCVGGTNQPT